MPADTAAAPPVAAPAPRAPGLLAGARLALGLLPGSRARVLVLTLLGVATSLLDTVAIGVVILLLQVAFGTTQAVSGFGVLGLVANFAHDLGRHDPWTIGGIVLAVVVAHSTLGAAYHGLTSHLRLQAYQTFRETVFANWVAGSSQATGNREPGAMVNTIQAETWEAADAVFEYCSLAIAGAIATVFVLVMAATSLLLTGIAALLAGLSMLLVGIVRRRLWQQSQRSLTQKEALARHFIGNLHALRTIKLFRAEPAVVTRSNQLSALLRRTFEAIVLLETALRPISDAMNVLVLGAILLAGTALGYPATVLLGFVMVLYRAQAPLLTVFQSLGRIARSQPSVAVVAEHMRPAPRPAGAEGREFRGLGRELCCRGVSFAYPGARAPVLQDLDLRLERGRMTVILGRSGAGKSTLINLLLQFLEPVAGAILCDDVPISAYDRTSWLRRIAVSGQDVELVDGTIRDNLLLGDARASDADLWEALELAGAADIARGLPRGLDAEVGARGVSLSGGQRQRLCLARALLVDADLLILDEATNAVDSVLEQSIYRRLRAARPGLTMLVVAHRPAVAQLADHVVVLEGGRAIESGAPAILSRRPGGLLAALVQPPPQPLAGRE